MKWIQDVVAVQTSSRKFRRGENLIVANWNFSDFSIPARDSKLLHKSAENASIFTLHSIIETKRSLRVLFALH